MKTADAGEQRSWRQKAGTAATNGDAGLGAPAAISLRAMGPPRSGNGSSVPKDISAAPAQRDFLSIRAENVLKQLSAELTGEHPPKGRWLPSGKLLRKLSFGDLQVARNCGRQTTDEIVRWAKSQGVIIERSLHAGKSLSAMWQDIVVKSSTGDFSRAEIAEALERSLRRKNTRIPVAFQDILVRMLNAGGE